MKFRTAPGCVRCLLLFVLGIFFCGSALEAGVVNYAGKVDPKFKSNLASDFGRVQAVAALPNGKIFVGGNFGSFISLNADGTRNASFTTVPVSVDGTFNYFEFNPVPVCAVAAQSDGSIVIGGSVRGAGGKDVTNVVRLKANGTVDTAFLIAGQHFGNDGTPEFHTIPTGPDNSVLAMLVQPDGKLVLAGAFTTMNGESNINGIGRLNVDGSLDLDFVGGTAVDGGSNSAIYAITRLANGQMIIGGSFIAYNGAPQGGIARLNKNGDLDFNFSAGAGVDTASGEKVSSVAVQTDGRIIVGGSFGSINGIVRMGIARLHSYGSIDTSFGTGGSGCNGAVNDVVIQSDGKIVAGGGFTKVNGVARNGIARLNSDGSLDTSFVPSSAVAGMVSSVTLQSNGKFLVGGVFAPASGSMVNTLLRLNSNGSLDTTFSPLTAASQPSILALARQTDDQKVLVAGNLASAEFSPATALARLQPDGSLDTSFSFTSGGVGQAVVAMPNHGVLAAISKDNDPALYDNPNAVPALRAGPVTQVRTPVVNPVTIRDDGTYDQTPLGTHGEVVLLKTDGSIDTSFSALTTAGDAPFEDDGRVGTLAVQADGKIVVGGSYSSLRNASATVSTKIARFNANGSRDTAFTPPAEFGSSSIKEVFALAVQPADRRILAADTHVDGSAEIVRLQPTGSADGTFNTVAATGGDIRVLVLQTDGKILAAGSFQTINAASQRVLVRLNANGTKDSSFTPGTIAASTAGVTPMVDSIQIQADKKILISGVFDTIGGVARHNLARLNANGVLDTNFDPADGANAEVRAILLTADGSILTGGDFTLVNGARHAGIARVRDPNVLPPVIQLPGTLSANTGKFFSYQVTATNSPTAYGADLKVPGLSFKNGLISGTPTSEGSYTIPVAVANAGGSDLENLSLLVKGPAPVITSSLNPASRQGVAFAYQITATNNPTAYAANLSVPGLSFNSGTGRIAGKPTQAGTYRVPISVANQNGGTAATLTLLVKEP